MLPEPRLSNASRQAVELNASQQPAYNFHANPSSLPQLSSRGGKRALDIGCGSADKVPPLYAAYEITGIDIDDSRLEVARQRHPEACFLLVRAENLRAFPADYFDHIYSNVALPYMDIPKVLSGMHWVLKPGGTLEFSLHSPSFALHETRKVFPKLRPTLFRLFVLANGLYFHLTGRVLRLGRTCESYQSERGIRLALRRAGFTACPEFHRNGYRFIVRTAKA